MALDVGDKRIGVATSDLLGITAQPLETWSRRSLAQDLEHFCGLIRERLVDTLVVGLPKNMDGSLGEQSEKVRAWTNALEEASGLIAIYIDERLTTVAANRTLSMGGASHSQRKAAVDQIAAALILETYMRSPGNQAPLA